MIRYKVINGVQTIEEICEHCAEPARTLHISEITFKHPDDPRTITIKDAENNDIVMKTKRERIAELTASFISKGLLDDAEAEEAVEKQAMKYGIRPDAMCSESIDIVNDVTQSYCYKTTKEAFLAKYSASYAAEVEFDITGSKVGMDRKGNVIRVKSEKRLDDADAAVKYIGPEETEWWREVSDDNRESYINRSQDCEELQERYGPDAVRSMKFVSNFRSEDEFRVALEENGCR